MPVRKIFNRIVIFLTAAEYYLQGGIFAHFHWIHSLPETICTYK